MHFPLAARIRSRCVRSFGTLRQSGAATACCVRTHPQLIPLGTTYFRATGRTGLPGTNAPDRNLIISRPVVHVPVGPVRVCPHLAAGVSHPPARREGEPAESECYLMQWMCVGAAPSGKMTTGGHSIHGPSALAARSVSAAARPAPLCPPDASRGTPMKPHIRSTRPIRG